MGAAPGQERARRLRPAASPLKLPRELLGRALPRLAAAGKPGRRASLPRPLAGRTILLVDDVITSGTTAAACSACLRRAGARRVELLALARAGA